MKKRLPITFFEKFYDAVNGIYPGFFIEPTPNIQKLNKLLAISKKITTVRNGFRPASKKEKEAAIAWLNIEKDMLSDKLVVWTSIIDKANHWKETYGTCIADKLPSPIDDEARDAYYVSGFSIVDSFLDVKANENESVNQKVETQRNADMDRLFWTMHRFNRRGKKTFRIEEQLMHELLLTDVTKVDASFLQMPYPALCLHLPFNTGMTRKNNLIEWVYITERVMVGIEEQTRIFDFVFISNKGEMDIAFLNLKDGDLYTQVVDTITSTWYSKLAIKESTEIMSFVMATLLYMNSRDAVGVDTAPAVYAKHQDSRFPVCSVGYGISINKSLHQASGSSEGSTQKNVLKWTVRGHFRKLESDRWKEKKTLWIRPFIKGKERDNAEQVMKPTFYTVQ